MAYVEGFVTPIKKQRLDEYRKMAKLAQTVWKEYGALEYEEYIEDDVKPGKVTSFPQAVHLQPDEMVAFAYVLYESRQHRDQVNEKVMKDPRMKWDPNEDQPFDMKRMFFGGFKPLHGA